MPCAAPDAAAVACRLGALVPGRDQQPCDEVERDRGALAEQRRDDERDPDRRGVEPSPPGDARRDSGGEPVAGVAAQRLPAPPTLPSLDTRGHPLGALIVAVWVPAAMLAVLPAVLPSVLPAALPVRFLHVTIM